VGEEGREKDDADRGVGGDWGRRREWRGGKEYDSWGPHLVVDMEFEI
jgi:hypothetical protein